MRCETCQKITFADIRFGRQVLQKPSFVALKLAAASGCDLCTISFTALNSELARLSTPEFAYLNRPELFKALEREMSAGHTFEDFDTSVKIRGLVYDSLAWSGRKYPQEQICVTIGDENKPSHTLDADLKVYARSGSPPARYITGRYPSFNPGQLSCLSRIKRLVSSCNEHHSKCASLSMPKPLPTRVLDVENERIIEDTHGRAGRYIALSYCWGESGKNVLLTRQNSTADERSTYDKFTSSGIRRDMLPRTIQDAMIVCEYFDIKYLWVDVLCIIQEEDDLADFKAEAPKMADYYSNAYFTLIAGSAQDCTEGFLNDRTCHIAAPCDLNYSREDLVVGTPDTDMVGTVSIGLLFDRAVGPTNTRAWTFQESELSHRSVTFGQSLFRFRCLRTEMFEDGDFKHAGGIDRDWTSENTGVPSLHDVMDLIDTPEAARHAYRLWENYVLSNYTHRKLSRSADKLAAIAGAARLFQKIFKCKYLYGLWEKALVRGLLWRSVYPGRWTTLRDVTRAPSWSWASMDARIVPLVVLKPADKFWEDPTNIHLVCLSHHQISGSLDAIRDNVAIPQGFELSVRGFVLKVWPKWEAGKAFVNFWLVGEKPLTNLAESQGDIQQVKAQSLANGIWDAFDTRHWTRPIYALLLITKRGLLLDHIDGIRYRRLGYFTHAKEHMFREVQAKDIVLI